jgi:hypothetical protein
MKKISGQFTFAFLFLCIITFSACQKETSTTDGTTSKQNVMVYLNDDPSLDFSKVLVDIRYVEVKVDTGRRAENHDGDDHDENDDHHSGNEFGKWDTLSVTPGIYDLMRLRNGADTLLANGFAVNGRITKLRFTLGDNNTVWTDSTHSIPLSICDRRQYVYAKVKSDHIDTVANGQVRINIDFDINKSIKRRDGGYCLQPMIKSYSHHHTGELEGKVLPWEARTLVKVFNSTDTAYGLPERDGEFKIAGLSDGNYDVLFDGTNGYQDTTIRNISISSNHETKLPTISLHK